MWPFRAKPAPEQKALGFGGFYLGSRLLAPAAASYDRLAKEGYGQNAVAYACANKIATAVASVEPQLFRPAGGKVERIDTSPLLDLLDRPNPLQSGREFMGHLASYFALSGNAYIHGALIGDRGTGRKPPASLSLLSPGHVEVVRGDRLGMPREYGYRPGGSTRYAYPVDQLTGRSELLHLKTFNPLSPWYGMAPMDAAALAIDLHNAGNVWNYSLLKQGARPSGALMTTGDNATLSEDQYQRLKAEIDGQYSGAGNAGRPLLLEGGLQWTEMSINPKDLDFLEGKNSAAREIALAFGVPPQLVGIPGSQTYANYEQATLSFWTDTVLPLIQLIYGGLNRWLTPQYGDGLYLWYDEEMIPALEPLRRAKAERIERMSGLTVDEKRTAMGYDSLDGDAGDVVLVPSTLVPLDLAGELPNLAEPGSEEDEQQRGSDE